MEKYVDKEFDELLDSVESVNDQFIKNFYNDEENQDEIQDLDEIVEEKEPVENFEEKVGENVVPQITTVENSLFSTSDLAETDLNSLMSSPIELELDEWSEPVNDEFIEKTTEIEELKEEEKSTAPVENSVDDILKLLDKAKNSEDFFEKLEEKIDD